MHEWWKRRRHTTCYKCIVLPRVCDVTVIDHALNLNPSNFILAVVNPQLLHGGDLRVALSEDKAGEFRWYNK